MRSPVAFAFSLLTAGAAAAQSPQTLYENGALRPGWSAQSSATVTLASTTVLDGTATTLRVALPARGAVRLLGASPLRPGALDTLSLRLNASAAASLRLLAIGSRGGWTTADVRLASFCVGGALPVNRWAECAVPLRALGVGRAGVTGVELREVGGAPVTLNVGAVRLRSAAPGADTTPPQVTVTAPAANATVGGTVTLSATASDAVGVVGVQFLVDGVSHGAEDTTPPYALALPTGPLGNGTHVLGARARDAAGNAATASVSVTVANTDVTQPTVVVTAPSAGATVSGTVAFSATASDDVGVVGVQFLVDGSPVGAEDTAPPYSLQWATGPSGNGAHVLVARARDAAGNTGTASISVTVANADVTPPTVAVTAPAAGGTVSGTVTFSATASDDVGVAGVQFLVDGSPLGAEDTASLFTVALLTSPLGNGAHVLGARARDAAGNTATASVSVTVSNADLTRPVVTLTAPAANATVSGTTALSATATDDVAVVGVQFQVDGVDYGAEDTAPPYAASWVTGSSGNGPHVLSARARDAAGNTASASVSVTVSNADVAPPTVSVTAPSASATVSGTVTLSASASDNVGVVGVQFLVDGSPFGAEDTAAPYAVPVVTGPLGNGTHVLGARARDAAGNTAAASVTVTVSNADVTPPQVSLTAPAANATVSGTVTVSATASDDVGVVGVQLVVDGADLGAEDTTPPFSVAWMTSGLANGAHVVGARARDAAGNATTASVSVTVSNADVTPPQVSLTAPAASAMLSGTVTLSASATDDVAVVGVQFLVDGANAGAEDTTAPYGLSLDTTALAAGPHVLGARARDAAGNTATATVNVTVSNADVVLPMVAVTAPGASAMVSGVVAFTASAMDDVGVVGVQFLVDGMNYGAEDVTPPYSVQLNAGTLAAGAHTLSARARDAAGNTATSPAVPVTVTAGASTTATYTALATLPAHADGVPTSAQWAHGAAMFVKDVQGGDLIGFFRGTASLRAAVSTNDGVSWTWVNPAAAVAAPEPLAVAQGPDGKVHLVGWSWALGVGYTRLTLARDGAGHVSGFSADVVSLAFPGSPNPADVSADLVVGTDASGTATLFWALYDDATASNRGRVVCGKTAPSVGALPTQTSHFVSLANAAGSTAVELLGSDAWASPHNAGVLLAQHPGSKDLWLQWGPMNTGDGLTLNTLPLKRARATSSGASTFALGAPTTVASFTSGWGVQNYAVFATASSVWFMYGKAASAVVIDKVNAAGVVTANALPSPLPTARSGGAFALNVNAAETRAWFGGRVGEDADPAMPNVVKFWNGTAWVSFTDGSSFVGFRMSRSSGWDRGLVMLQNNFDYTTHRPWVATLRSP